MPKSGVRKFNGKLYELETRAFTKSEAQDKVRRLRRSRNMMVRVVPTTFAGDKAYMIYVRALHGGR